MTKSIVFIDSRVADYEALIAGVNHDAEWVLVSAEDDGVMQMRQALEGHSNLDSIQIISHGSVGALYIGSTRLDSSNLSSYESELHAIGSVLSDSGDILLYGCNVAQGDAGVSFINSLANITQADIAASDDVSGTQASVGVTVLELAVGAIDSAVLDLSSIHGSLAVLNGSDGNDTLEGTVGNDTILAGAGSDQITGSGGADYIEGGDEFDQWSGDNILGGPGNDSILGGAGDDSLNGNAGNDSINGGAGSDSLSYDNGEGDDTLLGGTGNDTFTISNYWPTAGLVIVNGGDGDDLIQTGLNQGNLLTATGGAGIDTYFFRHGGLTSDYTITDFAAGAGGDRLDVSNLLGYSAANGFGYEGGNPMQVEQGYLRLVQSGADTLVQYDEDGVAGTNIWHTTVTLKNVMVGSITFDNFVGGIAPDGSDVPGLNIAGADGNDTLSGGYFDDTIFGGAGSDQIAGSGGADYIEGGDEFGQWSGDNIMGGPGNDSILGGEGQDYLNGNAGNDSIDGGAGNDYLTHNSDDGSDTLLGGVGNDTFDISNYQPTTELVLVSGGDGNDLILTHLDQGNRLTATGGAGVDTYEYLYGAVTGAYTITDFAVGAGGDRLNVSELLDYSAADGRGYEGGNPMAANQAYLRLVQSGADTLLQYDEDGAAGTAYTWHTTITLENVAVSGMTSDNFVNGIAPDGSDVPGLSMLGTASNETLSGSYFDDTILGGAGSDLVTGSGGADYIEGGDELDQWFGDIIEGGAGNDTILGGAGQDYLTGDAGNDSINGGAGNDSMYHNSGEGDDTLQGGMGNDTFTIWSGQSTAELVVVNGGDGNDLIETCLEQGNRLTATGGAGIDTYTYLDGGVTSAYTITDFAAGAGGDRLDVSKLLDYSAADGRGYGGGNPMQADQGYLRLVQSGADTLVQYDEDGAAGTANTWHTTITLKNVTAVSIDAHNFNPLTIEGTAGADTLDGGLGVDTLNGGAGNDVLDGNWGDDSMTGGAGNDLYRVDNLGDMVREAVGEGADRVIATVDYVLAGNVESLNLGSGAVKGTGNALNNVITGNSAGNILNGGRGADTLVGGLGNDTYYVDDSGDVVGENAGQGTDRVVAYIDYTLGGSLESLTLGTGALNGSGNNANNSMTGNAGNNALNGGLGNDAINGGDGSDNLRGGDGRDTVIGGLGSDTVSGGAGADSLSGGLGDDLYYVDVSSDVVTEGAGEGADIVYSVASTYTLSSGVEKGRISTGRDANLFGNDLNNILYAGAGNNIINGGAGTDSVSFYYGVSGATGVIANLVTGQASGSGTDTLSNIERIYGSNNADRFTGDANANYLYSYAGNDTLDGGAGNDTMVGGDGSDIYCVRNIGDDVREINGTASTGGVDTVLSYLADYALVANVENARIMGSGGGGLTGNASNNVIYANSGINVIDGGDGSDTISYRYASSTGMTGVHLDLAALNASGQATASGISGGDLIKNVENITGSDYADILAGNGGNNILNGGLGGDILVGGRGNDRLTLGGGADRVVFDAPLGRGNVDTLIDFSGGTDKLILDDDIFEALGITGTTSGVALSANRFYAAAGAVAGHLSTDRIVYDTSSGKLYYDVDGLGGSAAVQIALIGIYTHANLSAGDFLVVG